ncbi:RNA methyltransferase [Pseudoalteromonas xiamenensis]|uniref:RNA methyltransferase n=1 Tax=Pseudoalteromonas xiamenensis TaxID=882626 RepID=UPI0027E543AF|nr:RNA methyltransferase [Pseudoalteromonas xiamenensis]WMN59465.1 RNA methyltransferase [Pseudoalteromonas xiamenensis]
MASKNQLKLIRALGQKKYRKQYGQYLVQGEKNVLELLVAGIKLDALFATPQFIEQNQSALKHLDVIETEEEVLSKVSTLVSNNAAIAIVPIPKETKIDLSGWVLALDGVSDPGNLGTIIRVADWYGFKQIVLNETCADQFNPKTISATMGSFVRVNSHRTDLHGLLSHYTGPVYGAFLNGENVHRTPFTDKGVLVMGSESHGISPEIEALVTHKITIPAFGGAESLNVAMATGIIVDNIKRHS